ncbi:hypothetical protein I4U23_010743 [Adineta vaga]|nr:hypothetical protein I4U23_010743 [Adineta vaga]
MGHDDDGTRQNVFLYRFGGAAAANNEDLIRQAFVLLNDSNIISFMSVILIDDYNHATN